MDASTTVPPHRFLRALGLTCAALAVGAAAHLLGGATVAPLALAAAFPLVLGLAWPLTGRERGWLPIAGAQLAGQQVVHSLLGWGTSDMSGLAPDAFLYGHVVAAALVAVWLRRGEQRTWAAARRTARALAARWQRFLRLFDAGAAPHHPEPPARPADVPVPSGPRLRFDVVRRGPPLHV